MTNLIRTIFGRKTKATDSPSPPSRDLAALTAPLQREALHVVPSDEPSLSHLGGDPLLPSALAWPQRDGTRLRFLARLSLTELQAKAATPWLPQSGALLFFYDDDKQPWGFDPADRGGWSVLHVPDASSRATDEPADLLPHTSVTFRPIRVLPSSERAEVEALKLSDQELERTRAVWAERATGPQPVQPATAGSSSASASTERIVQ